VAFVLNVHVLPRSLDFANIIALKPEEKNRSAYSGFPNLVRTIEMFVHSPSKIGRQTNVQDFF
jgi:hypothetical protein